MIDESRHFFGKEVVKKLLDAMHFLKLNRFHWHLVDDQGWRIEIKKFPKLVEIGSKRSASHVKGRLKCKTNSIPHRGYYSQEDIKEIVKYAKEREIEVVPEIELPGHCMSALAAYPNLSCTGGPFEVPVCFGIKKEIYCAGKEEVFEFLEDVLREIMALFPFEVIHLGGDEVPKERWQECRECQKRIKIEELRDEEDLQGYFTNRIVNFLHEHGKTAMIWNERYNMSIQKDVIFQYWHKDEERMVKLLQSGNRFVISNCSHLYLDYNYRITPLSKTYSFEPAPPNLEKKYHKNILGIEAPMWTEWTGNEDILFWHIFPRLIALAEISWISTNKKNFNEFLNRLDSISAKLDDLKITYAHREEVEKGFFKRRFSFLTKWTESNDYYKFRKLKNPD